MKRRSKPPRDREMEKVKAMTTVSLSQNEMRDRLLADKTALEARLKELFKYRRDASNLDPNGTLEDRIKSCSAELRLVKAQLK